MDNATSALARMNMVLHDCPTAEIWQDNTLSHPHFKEPDGRPQDLRLRRRQSAVLHKGLDQRLRPGQRPLRPLRVRHPAGQERRLRLPAAHPQKPQEHRQGAVILPHGVLFRGGAEGGIRTRTRQQGYIKGIIGLPANLFYGTGIPACIIVLDKEGAAGRKGIFMIDASKGFIKDGNKNRLRAQDIHKIVDTFTRQLEIPLRAPGAAGRDRGQRLQPQPAALHRQHRAGRPAGHRGPPQGRHPQRDIDGLAAYWQVFPGVRAALFADADRPGYSQLQGGSRPDQGHHLRHPEFTAFNQSVTALFDGWKAANTPLLTGIQLGDRPKLLIEALSESLLDTFRNSEPGRHADRPLRRLPAPDGLLGRDHAGRCLDDRHRRLEGPA
jgi:type I restriction enzyme M protein